MSVLFLRRIFTPKEQKRLWDLSFLLFGFHARAVYCCRVVHDGIFISMQEHCSGNI